jgi:hypothetical protein
MTDHDTNTVVLSGNGDRKAFADTGLGPMEAGWLRRQNRKRLSVEKTQSGM